MTTLERIAHWTDLVDRWEAEGGSRKAFCEENGIGYASFLSWCKRIRPEGTSVTSHIKRAGFLTQSGTPRSASHSSVGVSQDLR